MTTKQKLTTLLVTFLIVLVVAGTPFVCYLIGKVIAPNFDALACFGLGCLFLFGTPLVLTLLSLILISVYLKVAEWLFDYHWIY